MIPFCTLFYWKTFLFHVFYQQDVHVACDSECIVIETKL